MTDRQHAVQIGEMFDAFEARVAELESRLAQVTSDNSYLRGQVDALAEQNKAQAATIAIRETALALLEAGKNHNAIEPMQAPTPVIASVTFQPSPMARDPQTEAMARRLSPTAKQKQVPLKANENERLVPRMSA